MVHGSARQFGVIAALAFFATVLAPIARAQDMNAAIDKAVQKYATVKTTRGMLQQTNLTAMGNTYNLAGPFQQQLPNLLSVRYTEPKGEVLVADGKSVYMYSPATNPGVAHRFALSGAAGSVNLIGLFLDKPRDKYTLSDSGRQNIDGIATRAVGLVPKQPMAEFRRATVWIEEETGIIRQFEVTLASGGVNRIKFVGAVQFNVPVDASQFKFTAPRGVKVVDGG